MKVWLGLTAICIGLGLGCASGTLSKSTHDPSAPSWPADDPRVRFEMAVETEKDLGRSTFFKRLAGQGSQALFVRPYGVAWDGNDLLVTDPGAGVVLRMTENGKIVRSRPDLLVGPVGVTVCLGGVVVADSRTGRVGLFDQQLRLQRWLAEDLKRPTGVACIPDGVAVVETAAHRIVIVGRSGDRRTLGGRGSAAGEFNFPAAVAAENSLIWVGDTLNFRIVTIDVVTGAMGSEFGHLGDSPGETPRIKGLAVDTSGHLWVSDAHLDLVALFDREGVFLTGIGGPGQADGEFSFPAGIAAHPDGRVAVVDSLNRRVQILRVMDDGDGVDREGQ